MLPTITETETEIDFCKELKRPLMTVFGLEQLTLYRKTSLIIYVKGNKQVTYQAKLFSYVPLMEPNVVTRTVLIGFEWLTPLAKVTLYTNKVTRIYTRKVTRIYTRKVTRIYTRKVTRIYTRKVTRIYTRKVTRIYTRKVTRIYPKIHSKY